MVAEVSSKDIDKLAEQMMDQLFSEYSMHSGKLQIVMRLI